MQVFCLAICGVARVICIRIGAYGNMNKFHFSREALSLCGKEGEVIYVCWGFRLIDRYAGTSVNREGHSPDSNNDGDHGTTMTVACIIN